MLFFGSHNNLWDNENTGVDGFSEIFDTGSLKMLSVFGRISRSSDVDFYVSSNGIDFYRCGRISDLLPGNSGSTDPVEFHLYVDVGARYIRIHSSIDVVANVSANAKR